MRTSEMIAMLEKNPKLKFAKNGSIAAENVIEVNKFGDILTLQSVRPCLNISNDYSLVREPVPVWEAIKALTEGKTVECECPGCVTIGASCHDNPQTFEPKKGGSYRFCSSQLQKGKWFIKGDEQHGKN